MAAGGPGARKAAEFAALVRAYRELVDAVPRTDVGSFLRACAVLLPRIYAAALELPDVEPEDDDLPRGEAQSPLRSLEALLGEREFYWDIVDPVGFDPLEPEEPGCGSIADDLADVYLDLVRPLTDYEQGRVCDAIWHWRWGLAHHWGDHLVDGMRAIHRLIHGELATGGE